MLPKAEGTILYLHFYLLPSNNNFEVRMKDRIQKSVSCAVAVGNETDMREQYS